MSIEVRCPGCGRKYTVAEKLAGKRATCQKCGSKIAIPASADGLEVLDDAPGSSDELQLREDPTPRKTAPRQPRSSAKSTSPRLPAGSLADLIDEELSAGETIPIAESAAPSMPTLSARSERARVSSADEEPFAPHRGHRRHSPGPNPESPAVTVCVTIFMVLIGLLCGVGLLGFFFAIYPDLDPLQRAYAVFGFGLSVVGTLAFFYGFSLAVGLAFSEGPGWGVPTLLICPFWFYYVISRWHVAQKALYALLIGAGLNILSNYLLSLPVKGGEELIGKHAPQPRSPHRSTFSPPTPPPPPSIVRGVPKPPVSNSTATSPPSRPAVETARRFMTDFAALPSFPALGEPVSLEPGVEFREIRLGVASGQPGAADKLYVYTPAGPQKPESIGCMLIAPAGATAFSGMRLSEGDRPEHLPYVRKGLIVVAYEVDGQLPEDHEPTPDDMQQAYGRFKAACAGLINARNALEFALARIPEVDPDHLYTAGHSSAGTLALLFAAHERRVKGCLTYAPVGNVPKNLGPDLAALHAILPESEEFFKRASPHAHARSIRCPVFLFYAGDDVVVPPSETEDFARHLRGAWNSSGQDRLKLHVASSGGHYEGMLAEGIPKAIEWLLDPNSKIGRPLPTARPLRQWAYQPEAAPAGTEPLGSRPIQLMCTAIGVQRIRFSSAESGRAVVVGRTTRDHWMDHFDLIGGKHLGRLLLPGDSLLADVSPDGTRALLLAQGFAEVWSLDDGVLLADWRYGQRTLTRRDWGALIDRQHVATLDEQRRLVVWSISDGKQVYAIEKVSCAALSPGRTCLAVFGGENEYWPGELFDAATGELRGSLAALEEEITAEACAFRRNGLQLVAADRDQLACWDLRGGDVTATIETEDSPRQLKFVGTNYVLADGVLFDTARQVKAWQFKLGERSEGWDLVAGSPDGRIWLAAAESFRAPAYLTPVDLLGHGVGEKIASSPTRSMLVARSSQITYQMLIDGKQMPPSAKPGPTRSPSRAPDAKSPRTGGSESRIAGAESPSAVPPSPVIPDPKPPSPVPPPPVTPSPPPPNPEIAQPPPGPAVPGPDTASPPGQPSVADVMAERMQQMAASRDYTRGVHVDLIVGDGTAVQQRMRWFPGAKRPVIGLRWGFGVQWTGNMAPPPIRTPQDLAALIGPAGPGIGNALQQRISEGKFGDWPEEGDARFRQVTFLGIGKQTDLQTAAARQGLSALMVASVSARPIGLTGRTELTMRFRLIDLATRQALWTSKSLSSSRAATAQFSGANPFAELMTDVLGAVDESFVLKPMPPMKPVHVQGRVTKLEPDFSTSQHDAMLPVLAELRYYQAKQLLTAEEAAPLYDQILGAAKGRVLAGGSEAERRAAVEAWLE